MIQDKKKAELKSAKRGEKKAISKKYNDILKKFKKEYPGISKVKKGMRKTLLGKIKAIK